MPRKAASSAASANTSGLGPSLPSSSSTRSFTSSRSSAPSVSGEDDVENTFRILIATDNHLGYAEKHPAKANDSFHTFEEILQLATDPDLQVDMILLGGDLFHENKPSRSAQTKCVELLRKYVLGDKPITFDFVSDPEVNFAHTKRRQVNYMDPNMNIGMPVFSIHGNHDDPSGLGCLSVMDLMHETGLINYFGKCEDLENLHVSPLLLRKGSTKLAVYGMSAVKDERLHRLFRGNKVTLEVDENDPEGWFNLLVLHQNRARHGETNYIPEHFLPAFVDLVFWGHEHECRLDPEESIHGEKRLRISQPGSSVATSLSDSEEKEKAVGLLEIRGNAFKMNKIPLKSVRPLVYKTISLDEEANIPQKGSEKEIQKKVDKFLQEEVREMIARAQEKLTGHPLQPTLPLVRLRIEYSNEMHALAAGRFGNYFHDQVANPSDILLFRKRTREKKAKGDGEFDPAEFEDALPRHMVATKMEDYISKYFEEQASDEKSQLKVLDVKSIAEAVKIFIEKDQKDAISTAVEGQIKRAVKEAAERNDALDATL